MYLDRSIKKFKQEDIEYMTDILAFWKLYIITLSQEKLEELKTREEQVKDEKKFRTNINIRAKMLCMKLIISSLWWPIAETTDEEILEMDKLVYKKMEKLQSIKK